MKLHLYGYSEKNCLVVEVVSVCLDDLLDILLADWALLVDDLSALLAEASMPARHHHSVDVASHAHFADIVIVIQLDLMELPE